MSSTLYTTVGHDDRNQCGTGYSQLPEKYWRTELTCTTLIRSIIVQKTQSLFNILVTSPNKDVLKAQHKDQKDKAEVETCSNKVYPGLPGSPGRCAGGRRQFCDAPGAWSV